MDTRNPDLLVEGKPIATREVRQQLAAHLPRLWRYGLVLSRNRDIAEELVQSTCVDIVKILIICQTILQIIACPYCTVDVIKIRIGI